VIQHRRLLQHSNTRPSLSPQPTNITLHCRIPLKQIRQRHLHATQHARIRLVLCSRSVVWAVEKMVWLPLTQRRKSSNEVPNWPSTALQSVSNSLSYHQLQYCDTHDEKELSRKGIGLAASRSLNLVDSTGRPYCAHPPAVPSIIF
jgi:hypothetical protein